MAASVTAATSASRPAWAASISMTSPWISVESTSSTTRRMPWRLRLAGWTAMSRPWTAASTESTERSVSVSAPDTWRSIAVTG